MNTVELEITDLAIDGKAVAHLNGKVTFLDAGLPGEKVLARITRSKPRYNQGEVVELLSYSDDRIAARCSHFGLCGGCAWQDLAYEKQLDYKQRQVIECVLRLAGLNDAVVADIVPCNDQFDYRNKMEFSFCRADDDGFTLGLHRRKKFDEVFDLEQCHIQSEIANQIVHRVRKFAQESSHTAYDLISHDGYFRFLIIRRGVNTDQFMVVLVTSHGPLEKQDELVAALKQISPNITTIIHGENGSKSNVATLERETVLYGPGTIEDTVLGKRFLISPSSFFQTNTKQAERLYSTAFSLIDPVPDDRVLDLYCGTGTIGLLLADRVAEVVGVEIVEDAVRVATENARLNGITNANFVAGNAKDILKAMATDLESYDLVILDPPRAGLHPKVLKTILTARPEKILYISCNPATFARDAKGIFQAGYSVSEIRPVDMFPHTRHIELAAAFSRTE